MLVDEGGGRDQLNRLHRTNTRTARPGDEEVEYGQVKCLVKRLAQAIAGSNPVASQIRIEEAGDVRVSDRHTLWLAVLPDVNSRYAISSGETGGKASSGGASAIGQLSNITSHKAPAACVIVAGPAPPADAAGPPSTLALARAMRNQRAARPGLPSRLSRVCAGLGSAD